MTFSKRLRFYLMGFCLGILACAFFFKGRGCGWLPENRVLLRLSQSYILISDSMLCVLQCNGIDSLIIKNTFKQGEVLFSESKPNNQQKMYVLKGKKNNQSEFKISVLLKDSLVTINQLYNSSTDCLLCTSNNTTILFARPDEE